MEASLAFESSPDFARMNPGRGHVLYLLRTRDKVRVPYTALYWSDILLAADENSEMDARQEYADNQGSQGQTSAFGIKSQLSPQQWPR